MEIERLKIEISSLKDELIASVKANSLLKDEIINSTKEVNLLNQKVSNLEKEMDKFINKRLSSSQ
jgi:hypothetical protein